MMDNVAVFSVRRIKDRWYVCLCFCLVWTFVPNVFLDVTHLNEWNAFRFAGNVYDSIYCIYSSLTFTRNILIHSTFQSFSVAMFSIKDGYLCKQTIYMFMHRTFFDGSSFTVRKQLIRFSPTTARAASPQNGRFALTVYSIMKNSRAFSHNCAFCLELLPCQLNWATQLLSAQPSNCCLVRATYWATVTLEHLMTSLVGSRFFLPHT